MIRVRQDIKETLDKLGKKNESYSTIIQNLINKVLDHKNNKRKNLEINNFYSWFGVHKFLMRFWIFCEECNKSRARELHHKDKDRTNNRYENIEFLCKKCHLKKHKIINENKYKHSR